MKKPKPKTRQKILKLAQLKWTSPMIDPEKFADEFDQIIYGRRFSRERILTLMLDSKYAQDDYYNPL